MGDNNCFVALSRGAGDGFGRGLDVRGAGVDAALAHAPPLRPHGHRRAESVVLGGDQATHSRPLIFFFSPLFFFSLFFFSPFFSPVS
jgi:hypothetical protein